MRSIWAVARATFIECLRTRIAMVFLVLLAVCVLGMAMTLEGDGTLKGRIQTFLSYSVSTTQILLGLVTVFLTTSILTSDMRRKTIFTVASKPLHRWQYVSGRWLGIVLLNAALLTVSVASIYGLAHWLRGLPTQLEAKHAAGLGRPNEPDMDRLGVDNEVFTARERRSSDPLDVEAAVNARMEQLVKERGLDAILRGYVFQQLQEEMASRRELGELDEREVQRLLQDSSFREKTLSNLRIRLRGEELGRIYLVQPGQSTRMTFSGLSEAAKRGEPLQMQYELYPMQTVSSSTLQTLWVLVNPKTGDEVYYPRTDSTNSASSLMVPSGIISDDGHVVLYYVNNTNLQDEPVAVKIKPEDIRLMYRTGGFEDNLLRSTGLILLRLSFLAAAGVLFGTCLSFPVACLTCLLVFGLGAASAFVVEATQLHGGGTLFERFCEAMAWVAFKLIPTFGNTSPVDPLVDGTLISLNTLGWALAGTGGRTVLALALGCLIFWRRELARVQV